LKQLIEPAVGARVLFRSMRPPTPLCARPIGMARARAASTMAVVPHPPLPLFFNDTYEVVLPPKHRFPMRKYRMVREGLERELAPQRYAEFERSPLVSLEDLATTHCPEYSRRYVTGRMSAEETRRVGFPWYARATRHPPSPAERSAGLGVVLPARRAVGV